MSAYQKSRLLKIGFFFKPFVVASHGQPLAQAHLHPEEELILLRCNHQSHALLAREMAYHHVAQGELAGQPFLVTF